VPIREQLLALFGLVAEGLARLEELLLTILLMALMGLGLTQIVLRNLGLALPWADGLMRAMVLWLAMIAGVMAAGRLRHIRINLLDHWLSERFVNGFGRLADLITAFLCLAMTWYGLKMVRLELDFGAVAFLGVPVWLVQIIVPLGFGLMAARYLAMALAPQRPEPPAPMAEIGEAEESTAGASRP